MTTWWHFLGNPPSTPPCGEHGSYDHKAAGGNSGPAYKHTDTTGHATVAAAGEWAGRTAA